MFRALIVEDDMLNQEFLCEALSIYNGHCDSVNNGEDALISLINNTPYDLIILDVKMPIINGLLVLKIFRMFEELKTIANPTKILISSGYEKSSAISDLKPGLCNGYLMKPYDVECIKNKLNELGLLETPC